MNECVRLIIGGDRGIEERGVRGRWIDLIQTNLGGREGTAMLGTKRGRHPHPGRSQPSRRQRPNTPKPKRVFEVARRCDEETVSRNIFSVTQKISTKTGGSKIQMDLGTRGQTGPRIPGARINFINDEIIIRRIATLVSGPAARAPSWHVCET